MGGGEGDNDMRRRREKCWYEMKMKVDEYWMPRWKKEGRNANGEGGRER
jgi:hypothetical protein